MEGGDLGLPLAESPEASPFSQALRGLLDAIEAGCREMGQEKCSIRKKLIGDRRFCFFALLYMQETEYLHFYSWEVK